MKVNQSLFLILFLILVFFSKIFAQDEKTNFEPTGNIYGILFTNFHSDFISGNSAFEVQRAYLGYKYKYDNNFSVNVKIDIASIETNTKRYAYFKNAHISYNHENLTLNFGLIDSYMFKTHEKFFGKRYIYKSFLDKNKFGPSADLGASILYQIGDKLNIDFSVLNGEGYSNLQLDNTLKAALGISYNPIKNFYSRIYVDYSEKTYAQTTYSFFLGYKQINKFSLGAEYNLQANNSFANNYDLFGYSIYGTINISEKWELFARFDDLKSNIPEGESDNWNLSKDGNLIISGIQFSPIKKVKLALNYQGFYSDDSNKDDISAIYFNIEYKF